MKNKSVNKGDPRMRIGTQRYRCICIRIQGVPLVQQILIQLELDVSLIKENNLRYL